MPLWTHSVSHRFLLRRGIRQLPRWIAHVEPLEDRCLLAFTVNHTPYLQLGNAALTGYDNGTDQAELIWQTTGVAENDTFTAQFRHNGDLNWNSTSLNIDIVTGVDGRINHSATLTGLAFDSDYDYLITHLRAGSPIATYQDTFHTRLDSDDQGDFSFVTYGDSAFISPTNFINVQTEINAIDPAFSLLLGDNVYFSGTHAEFDLRLDPSINAPLTTYNKTHIDYFSFGNHDEGYNSGQAAHENYSMPVPIQGATSPVGLAFDADVEAEENYSFDYGSVHFVTFDTNNWTNPEALDKQLDWAVADITAARARVNPPDWVIVFGHHPITSLGGHSEHNAETYYYHQVLSRLGHGAGGVGVDLLLAGHTHNYQRSYPLTGHQGATVTYVLDTDNYYAKGSGLPLVVQGTGGISLGYGADDAIYSGTYLAKAMDSNTSIPAEFGFGKVDVEADHLTYTYINSLGQVLDSFSIGMAPPDVTPPEANLASPLDNGFSDLDPATNQVTVSTLPAVLRIKLSDSEQGIDDGTVLPTSVSLTRNSVALVEGVDYAFTYSSATDEITLSPLPAMGLAFGDGSYSISLASTIEDQANNPLTPTVLDIVVDTSLPAIVAFQQDLEGYTGSLDTYVHQDEPAISHGSNSKLNADGDDDLAPSDTEAQEVQGLIRFNDLFLSGGSASRTGGPIPDGAHIVNATLQVRTGTASGDVSAATFNLHRMLVDWNESDTWVSMVVSGLGIARDDIEASSSATATVSGGNVNVAGGWVSFDVTADLQLWSSNPSLDLYGWLIHPDAVELGGDPVAGQTDGWWFDSSEAEIEANRPVLIVNYVPPPSNVSPGGPYVIQEGDTLALNGSATGVGPLTYEWDVNADGIFGDASGASPVLNWTQLVSLGLTDGLLVRNLAVRVTDSFGQQVDSTTASPTTLTVVNAAPTASISGTTDIYRGETVTFTLSANDPSPVDQASLFDFEIDWDGNGSVDETLLGVPGGTSVQHKFPTTAMNNIQVRATDKDASTGDFSQLPITVSTHVLRDDGFGNTDLIWGGTDLLDAVYVLGGGSALQLFVQFDGLQFVNRLEAIGAGVTGKIILYGYGFSDVLIGEFATANVVEIHGGDGDDVIVGGFLGDLLFGEGGNDVILGGTQAIDGGDMLFGGEGKDVLFGHYGADTLHGGAGEDLLISDRYAFNDIPQAVQKIANEWKSSRPFAERVSNIQGITSTGVNGSDILGANVTVGQDGSADELIGGLGEIDWFFYDFDQDLLGDTIEVNEAVTDSNP